MKLVLRGHLRRFARSTEGSNAIEFAILAVPFILLIVGIIQISIYFVAQAAPMQSAAPSRHGRKPFRGPHS